MINLFKHKIISEESPKSSQFNDPDGSREPERASIFLYPRIWTNDIEESAVLFHIHVALTEVKEVGHAESQASTADTADSSSHTG